MAIGQDGKQSLQLTRKERQLLALLEGSPGQCFSRPYLLTTIWGYGDETETRTVDVHVSRLRKKLKGRPNVAIHAVVRQGYVLEQHGVGTVEPHVILGFSSSAAAAVSAEEAILALEHVSPVRSGRRPGRPRKWMVEATKK